MGAITGEWKRANQVGYVGPSVWGTGINRVHYSYGAGDARGPIALRENERVTPFQAVPDPLIPKDLWGYTCEDSLYTGVSYDNRPSWDETTSDFRDDTGDQPSWSASGKRNSIFRGIRDGAHRTFRGQFPAIGYVVPTETVSEGWINKPKGETAKAEPSDDKQLTRQTSMQQRFQTRNNDHSVARGWPARHPISSRVRGMIDKTYSGGERHWDMFPRQQDLILRPFWYRTAGTGPARYLIPNQQWVIEPIERIPPPDPSIGKPEAIIPGQYGYEDDNPYGYTQEDEFYAGY